MKRAIILQIIVLSLLTTVIYADSDQYWPTWRGPNTQGISPKGNPPLKWSESENIKWKVQLPGDESSSSPIIWKDKIFFQVAIKTDVEATAESKSDTPQTPQVRQGRGGGERSGGGRPSGGRSRGGFGMSAPKNIYKFDLVCLDRKTGKTIWQKTACEALPHQGHHRDHGYASFSPVTDGKHVWASFGSRGIYCYDFDGNKIWSRELTKMKTMFGEGSSPSLAGDAVIVVTDNSNESHIWAFEKATGKILWKKLRDEESSYATPLPVMVDGKLQIVTSATNLVRSYDAVSGDLIWQCGGQTRNVIPTPVVGHELIYCTSGFRGSNLQAIKLGKTGDLTDSDAIAWQVNQDTPYVPSPLLYEDKLYVCQVNQEVISCYNAKSGEPFYTKQKLDEIKGIYASPTAAAGRIYFVGRNGITYVIKPTGKFEVLAINKLDDSIDCSPAFIDNEMFLKGKKNLYCIAE